MRKFFIVSIYILLFALNLTPVIVFNSQADFLPFSIPALILMVLVIVNGIVAYIFRHKGNFLYFRKIHPNIFSTDKEYTLTSEYSRKFKFMLEVYAAAIPFYIPLIFFTSSWKESLWVLPVFLIPQIIFVIQDIIETIKNQKQHKIKMQQQEEELRKQQQREELGHWK